MFLKPCVQAVFSSDNNNFSDSNSFSVPTNVIEEPIIALFDGVPQANHPLLKGMLMVDDPDGFESFMRYVSVFMGLPWHHLFYEDRICLLLRTK